MITESHPHTRGGDMGVIAALLATVLHMVIYDVISSHFNPMIPPPLLEINLARHNEWQH